MALAMEFDFLLNAERMLLSIGFVVRDGALDESCYDLLASEARLASYIAIAKGDLPPRHWFRLGHDVTPVDGGAALDVLVGLDVRISDAVARHAHADR